MARRTPAPTPQPAIFMGRSTAGISVTPDSALKYSAVWRAIQVIADTVAGLPMGLFAMPPGGSRELVTGHGVSRLLNVQANPETTAYTLRHVLTAHAVVFGNGYAEIERNRIGEPIALWQLDPLNIEPKRDSGGRLFYEVRSETGEKREMRPQDTLHLRGPSHDGIVGQSLVALANEAIGLGIAIERFGAAFFGNGAQVGGVYQTDQRLSEDAIARMRESLTDRHVGVGKAWKPAILEEGLKFQATTIDPEKSQLKDARLHQVRDIARWFGVPPHKLADLADATFSNVEQQNRAFADEAIKPWTTRWEQELKFKLLINEDDLFIRADMFDLIRADIKSLADAFSRLIQVGVFTPNQVREKLDENTMGPEADRLLIQGAMKELGRDSE
ncbi:MAG: phage portal protein [Sphingomonadales bacterium]